MVSNLCFTKNSGLNCINPYVISLENALMNGEFPVHLNRSLITLIPKIDNPENITQFRPITLCNVSYKIVTKIIVQRLRCVLDKIVGPFQASFMLGRHTKDNIIITQEVIYTLMNKKGKKGGLVLKIDLEKAYDWIDWDFLEKVLYSFNFEEKCIKLILSCVTKGESNVLWNGEKKRNSLNRVEVFDKGTLSHLTYVFCAWNTYLIASMKRLFLKTGLVLKPLLIGRVSPIFSSRMTLFFLLKRRKNIAAPLLKF